MKNLTKMLLVGLVGLSMAFTGCDSDDDSNPSADTSSDTTADTSPITTDLCVSANNKAIINGGTVDPTAIASSCGTGAACIPLALQGKVEEFSACTNACIVQESGLSEGCASCYTASVACAAVDCLTECGADPASQACTDCRATNCPQSVFDTCTGDTAE